MDGHRTVIAPFTASKAGLSIGCIAFRIFNSLGHPTKKMGGRNDFTSNTSASSSDDSDDRLLRSADGLGVHR